MSSRDVILQRIRSGLTNAVAAGFGDLRDQAALGAPPVPEVWPRTNSVPAALAPRFQAELKALNGEAIPCPTMADARRQLAQLMETAPWARMGSLDRPIDSGSHGRPSSRSPGLGDVRLDSRSRSSSFPPG